jgi:DNA-binding NtrC family response regulator
VLAAHGDRRTATARTLGVTREGLYKKPKRLGIE